MSKIYISLIINSLKFKKSQIFYNPIGIWCFWNAFRQATLSGRPNVQAGSGKAVVYEISVGIYFLEITGSISTLGLSWLPLPGFLVCSRALPGITRRTNGPVCTHTNNE